MALLQGEDELGGSSVHMREAGNDRRVYTRLVGASSNTTVVPFVLPVVREGAVAKASLTATHHDTRPTWSVYPHNQVFPARVVVYKKNTAAASAAASHTSTVRKQQLQRTKRKRTLRTDPDYVEYTKPNTTTHRTKR